MCFSVIDFLVPNQYSILGVFDLRGLQVQAAEAGRLQVNPYVVVEHAELVNRELRWSRQGNRLDVLCVVPDGHHFESST